MDEGHPGFILNTFQTCIAYRLSLYDFYILLYLFFLQTVWLSASLGFTSNCPSCLGRQEFRQFTKHTQAGVQTVHQAHHQGQYHQAGVQTVHQAYHQGQWQAQQAVVGVFHNLYKIILCTVGEVNFRRAPEQSNYYNYLCTCKSYGPVHNDFHAGKSITRGIGPWNLRYLWAP